MFLEKTTGVQSERTHILASSTERRISQAIARNVFKQYHAHFNYLRMSKEHFEDLFTIVGHRENYWSPIRAKITPAKRLALTIRYLVTGNSQISLYFIFHLGKSTTCLILRETCEALWNSLMPQYVKSPSTETEWKGVSNQFECLWNFPYCVGAINGKHIVIQASSNCDSTYFNYKGTHSVVLMAVCDAHYQFIWYMLGIQADTVMSDRNIYIIINRILLSINLIH